MKLAVVNGPNLNLLGIREPDIYGKETYEELIRLVQLTCKSLSIEVLFYQSNHEGDLVDFIQSLYKTADAMIINPAAYTHTSIAIPDAIKAVGIKTIEVHLSDISKREDFRKHSYVSPVCIKTICGKGIAGYLEAVHDLYEAWKETNI